MILEVGNMAPDFEADIDGDETIRLSDLRGKKVVIYFYPKDNTPGCTKESCGFRDSYADFIAEDCVILGVSRDNVRSHDNFRSNYDLPFRLVSDLDGGICESYSVWVQKKNYGREYMGIERSTFLIDSDGVIRSIWRNVRVNGHVDIVLESLRAL